LPYTTLFRSVFHSFLLYTFQFLLIIHLQSKKDRSLHRPEHHKHQDCRHIHQLPCPPDILRFDGTQVVPKIFFFIQLSKINRIPCKTDPESARADSLGLCRIGACMFPSVPQVDPPRILSIHSDEERRSDHEQSCDPRRYEVEHIIHPCRKSSEIQIFLILISQHGIHRIVCLVQEPERRSSQKHEQKGRCHSVGCIFRHRLHSCLGHPLISEILCIPSHDHGHGLPGPGQIVLLQPVIDLPAFLHQTSCRQDLIAPEALNQKPQRRVYHLSSQEHRRRDQKRKPCRQKPQHGSRRQLSSRRLREQPAQGLFSE